MSDAPKQTAPTLPPFTDADMLSIASAFDLIPFDRRVRASHIRELKIERRSILPDAWAIVSEGNVLARDGMWEWEPSPSHRDDGFFARCRWPDARSAIEFARQHIAQHPTGYKPEDQ